MRNRLCAQNKDNTTILKFNSESLCDHYLRRIRIYTSTSHTLCISTLVLMKRRIPISVVHYKCYLDETLLNPIQRPKLHVDLEVPTTGPHTLFDLTIMHTLKLRKERIRNRREGGSERETLACPRRLPR